MKQRLARGFGPTVREVGRQYVPVIASTGATRALTLLASLILARSLGVRDFGEYAFAYTVSILVAQLPSVLDASFVRHYSVTQEPARQQSLLKAFLRLKLMLLGMMLVVSVAVVVLGRISSVVDDSSWSRTVFAGVVAGAFLGAINSALAVHQARGRFLAYGGVLFGTNLVAFCVLLGYLAIAEATPLGAMLAFNTIVYAVAACLILTLFAWSLRGESAPTAGLAGVMVRFSGWMFPATLIYVAFQRVDMLLIAQIAEDAEVGLYAAAVTIASVMGLLTSNLQVVFLPKAGRSIAEPGGVKQYLAQGAVTSSLLVAAAAILMLLADVLVDVVLGPDYAGAAAALQVLLLGHAFVAVASPWNALMLAAGRTKVLFGQRVVELATAVVAALILIPRHGSLGAAIAMACAYFGGLLCLFSQLVRFLRSGATPRAGEVEPDWTSDNVPTE